jgi:hypothetical protein
MAEYLLNRRCIHTCSYVLLSHYWTCLSRRPASPTSKSNLVLSPDQVASRLCSAPAPPREVGQHNHNQGCNHNDDQRHLEKVIRIQDHRRNSISALSSFPARHPVCAHLYLGTVATPERFVTIISCFSVCTQVAFSETAPYPRQSYRRNKKAHQVLLYTNQAEPGEPHPYYAEW